MAEVLLQRTRADQVVPVYQLFKDQFPSPKILARTDVAQITRIIEPLGLRWRARYIHEFAVEIQKRDGTIPTSLEDLLKLPGVGPYIAAAFLSFHTGQRYPIIDSNIIRFYGRFFGFDTGPDTRRNKTILELADLITPRRKCREFNYSLIDFTRSICKLQPVHCLCPVAKHCVMVSGD